MALLTLTDVEKRLQLVLGFFENDTTRFAIHLSRYLYKNQGLIRSLKSSSDKKPDQSNQEEKKKEKQETKKVTTDMDKKTETKLEDKKNDLVEKITSAAEGVNLLELMKSADGPKPSLEEAQRIRRSSALGVIASSISTGDGRSVTEKSTSVVTSAIELANTEEKEDKQLEEEEHEFEEDFSAGDEVVIIEGDNCGLFGTLQHSTTGIFAALDDTVKEDDDGYFGVDVHLYPGTKDATTEGFWIHPEALQHKKYEANDEVYVTDGLNKGRYGNTQSDNGRLAFDDGCYGVDVKMDDGSIEGYWIHPTSMIPASESPERKKDTGEKKEQKKEQKQDAEEEDPDLAEVDKFEFLPYIAYPGDPMDEALAELLNTHELDINIKRLSTKNGKHIYRYGGKRHLVRYIHGVLLVNESNGGWTELTPVLKKLASKK